jgi:hypothetical protein
LRGDVAANERTVMEQDDYQPRQVEHLAAMLKGQGTSRFKAVARPIVLRVPEWTLAELDAMAKLAGKSRNSMACHLLSAAIEEVRSSMDAPSVTALNEATMHVEMAMQANTVDREQVEG